MANNTKQIMERMQASFPHIYNVYDKNTILYALLSIFSEKYGVRTDIIDRLYSMIGIDSTYNEDLEHRWGSLLGVYKQIDETYDEYRNRLKIIYSSLNGGTAKAIKYAVASASGIDSSTDMIDKYVNVYDAWKYPYDIDPLLLGIKDFVDETSLYGSIICTVDLAGIDTIIDNTRIMSAINQTKASGINPHLIFLHNVTEPGSFPYNSDSLFDAIKCNVIYENVSIFNINKSAHGSAVFGNETLGNITLGDVIYRDDIIDTFIDDIKDIKYELSTISPLDVIADKFILKLISESLSISMTDDTQYAINNDIQDDAGLEVDISILDSNIETNPIHESISLDNKINTNIWSSFGTNSAILNKSLVTNMYMESDEHVDIIRCTAVLGKAILGRAVLDIKM